jgi:hypothetical protein
MFFIIKQCMNLTYHTFYLGRGTGGSFLGVKRPDREADHSPPTSAEVKVDLDIHSPVSLHVVVFI